VLNSQFYVPFKSLNSASADPALSAICKKNVVHAVRIRHNGVLSAPPLPSWNLRHGLESVHTAVGTNQVQDQTNHVGFVPDDLHRHFREWLQRLTKPSSGRA
jgi:hypothetical protein